MSELEIKTIAAELFERYLDRHWELRFEDRLPIKGGDGELAGHCSWNERIIRLSRRYALDWSADRLAQTLAHEIAHALTPEDWTHGAIFQAKRAELFDDLGLAA